MGSGSGKDQEFPCCCRDGVFFLKRYTKSLDESYVEHIFGFNSFAPLHGIAWWYFSEKLQKHSDGGHGRV